MWHAKYSPPVSVAQKRCLLYKLSIILYYSVRNRRRIHRSGSYEAPETQKSELISRGEVFSNPLDN